MATSLLLPRTAKSLIATKAETTAGTDIFAGTWVGADVMNVDPESIRFSPDPNETEIRATGGHYGRQSSILGATTGRLDITMPLRGSGAAYSATVFPEANRLLLMAMLAGTLVDTVSWSYKPGTVETTYTVYVVFDMAGATAHVVKMVGCIATLRLRGVAGEGLFADFTIFGAYTRADHTYVAGTIPITPAYPTFKSAAFQIGSTNYAPCIADVGLDLGVSVRYQRCMNAVSGVAGAYVGDRRPRLTLTPVADLTSNMDWWTRLSTGAPLDDCSFQAGGTAFNRIKFRFGSALGSTLQTISQSFSGRDGIVIAPTEFLPTINAGEDDFALLFD